MRFEPALLFLGAFALADVPDVDDDRVHSRVVKVVRTKALEVTPRPVLVPGAEQKRDVLSRPVDSGLENVASDLDVIWMNQIEAQSTHQLIARMPQHPLQRSRRIKNAPLAVSQKDAIRAHFHQGPKPFLTGSDGVLRLLLHREITQIPGKQRRTIGRDANNGEFGREFRSIGAHRRHFDSFAQDGALACCQVACHAACVLGAQSLRDDEVGEGAASCVFAPIPKDPLGSGVELDHFAVVIHGDDRVERRLEDGGVAPAGLTQFPGVSPHA